MVLKSHNAVRLKSIFCTAAQSFFVLVELKMEAERGSVVKTAYVMVTAIL